MAHDFDLLVVGEINPDLILTGDVAPAFGQVEKLIDRAELAIGSSSAIFACGAVRLGLKTAFVGKCGDDLFGGYMLDEMQQHGVDIQHVIKVSGQSTGLSVILNRGSDRAILTYPGVITALQADEITDDILGQAAHVHVASYFLQTGLQPGLPNLLKRAHRLGLTTSLDTNYDPSGKWADFDELLSLTDVFLPNEAEACALAGTDSADLAATLLSQQVETLAIKLGARGALGVARGRMSFSTSIPVEVVDTVGAGDSFDAGFVYGYLQGWPIEKTLRAAVICGSLSTRALGGTAGQASLPELLTWLSET